jgi:hypothetical protein
LTVSCPEQETLFSIRNAVPGLKCSFVILQVRISVAGASKKTRVGSHSPPIQSLCSNIQLYQSMRLLHQFNCAGIDVKTAAEWPGFYTGRPLAIVAALNLKYKSKPSPDAN